MKGHMQKELVIEESVSEEPPEVDDEDFSFDIITEEEIARLSCPFSSTSMSSSASSASMSSQGSNGSLGSTGSSPTTPAVIRARNIPKNNFQNSTTRGTLVVAEDELTNSAKIWYRIQIKGHYQEGSSSDCLHEFETMESSSMKKTNWFLDLLHLHEKLKQNAADKRRFNINSIPEEAREQLKHIYVY
jgi:hypothetical protein